MMPRWLFCFSIAAGLGFVCAQAATVSGTIQLTGQPRASRDRNSRLSDIVVWLEPIDSISPTEHPPQHVRMLQKDKMFRPHVLPILAGTTVDFPNADPIFHNAFSNYDRQLFDVALYAPGTSRSVVFRKPGVARVFCNIHPSMSAIILVLKSPYFARVGADGKYRVSPIPPGRYALHFYDDRSTDDSAKSVLIAVEAAFDRVNAPTLHISEAGYVSHTHKNKYGQDYPPQADSYGGGMGPPK
jgi:plastocyanin